MNLREMYRDLFADRVVEMVQKGDYLSEVECEPVIRQWTTGLKSEVSPTVVEIQMKSKRTLNHLAPID